MGGAAVGGKKAAVNAAANLVPGLAALKPMVEAYPNQPGDLHHFYDDGEEVAGKITDPNMLKLLGGVPEFMLDEWREDNRNINIFDPDIASMNSFSLAAKINLQRERNLTRFEEQFYERGYRRAKQKAWEKINGRIRWW